MYVGFGFFGKNCKIAMPDEKNALLACARVHVKLFNFVNDEMKGKERDFGRDM